MPHRGRTALSAAHRAHRIMATMTGPRWQHPERQRTEPMAGRPGPRPANQVAARLCPVHRQLDCRVERTDQKVESYHPTSLPEPNIREWSIPEWSTPESRVLARSQRLGSQELTAVDYHPASEIAPAEPLRWATISIRPPTLHSRSRRRIARLVKLCGKERRFPSVLKSDQLIARRSPRGQYRLPGEGNAAVARDRAHARRGIGFPGGLGGLPPSSAQFVILGETRWNVHLPHVGGNPPKPPG